MTPVSPVLLNSDLPEVVLGENQPEYIPLPAAVIPSVTQTMVTRWRLSESERQQIANGHDIVLQQLTFGRPFQPVNLQVVAADQKPEFV